MSETCQELAFTHPIVVLKSGLKNNWMKKLDRVNRPKGNEFCMSMSYHIKQQVAQDIFSKKVPFSWKTTKLDSFVFS